MVLPQGPSTGLCVRTKHPFARLDSGTNSCQGVSVLLHAICMVGRVHEETVTKVRMCRRGQIVDNVTKSAFARLDGSWLLREVRDEICAPSSDWR